MIRPAHAYKLPTLLFRWGLVLAYAFFCYLMWEITMQYIPVRDDAAFLKIKQDVIGMSHYKWAFFIHAFTAILVLPAGFTQFSKWIRLKHPSIHRGSGWIYTAVVLLLAGPSGLVIGIYANGGLWSQIAFCLLAVLWILFTILAIRSIRKKDFSGHRAWMIRSFALALSAITLRAWKFAIINLFHTKPMDTYQWVAWLGWTVNLAVAEIIIYRINRK